MNKTPKSITQRHDGVDDTWRLFAWDGAVRLTAKHGALGVTGGVIKSKAALSRALHNLEQGGWDIYVGANPSRGTRIKAATREVEVWRYVVIDLDPVDPECAPELAIEQVLEAGQERVADLIGAGNVCFTGRGAQAWIAICPTPLSDVRHRSEVERGMGAFLHWLQRRWGDGLGYRIDTSTSDLARIVRCPGTINTKTGRRAKVIRFDRNYEERGRVQGLAAERILQLAGPAPPEPIEVVNCSNLNIVAPHLNDRARQFLRMGVHEGERHKSAYAAAANLRELGIPLDMAVHWVRRGGRKCYPKLYAVECDHALKEAWKGR